MVLLAGVGAVTGAVQVQNHVILPRPLRHRLDRGVADHQIDHDDGGANFLGEFGATVHLLHRAGGDVEIVTLDLAGLGRGPVHRLHAVEETVPPVHERLAVDVLVVLHEVQAALEPLVDDAAVILRRQPELGFGGGTQQWPTELVESLALDDDPGGRALVGLHVGHRQPHVLQPRRLERLETEHVADDGGGEVGDRALLEQDQVVGDVTEELTRDVGHRFDPVGLGPVLVCRGEPIRPHDRPRGRRALPRHGRGSFDRIDALLRSDPEQRQYVGVFGFVVAVPVTHLGILEHAGFVAFLASDFAGRGIHGGCSFRSGRLTGYLGEGPVRPGPTSCLSAGV